MGIIDTNSPRAKFGMFLILLAAPFIIFWNFLKWIGERLGIYKPKQIGLTPEQLVLEDELRKQRESQN